MLKSTHETAGSSDKDNLYNTDWGSVTKEEFKRLLERRPDPEGKTKRILYLVGIFLTPITLLGALLGYRYAFVRLMFPRKQKPVLSNIPAIVKWAMVIGGAGIWVALIGGFFLAQLILSIFIDNPADVQITLYIMLANLFFSFLVMIAFQRWRIGYYNLAIEQERFGTAEFADPVELRNLYKHADAFYVALGLSYKDRGHFLTCAGTRGGKGTNIIIPNLLGMGWYSEQGFNGSWVVIDPKGENAAITARYQRERGKNVIILNPWNLLRDRLGDTAHYNPLDLLIGGDPMNLADDVGILAEMIVPFSVKGQDNFFDDRARSLIAGLMLYLVLQKEEPRTLTTLWNWLRLPAPEFQKLMEKMIMFENRINGDIIHNTANEMASVKSSERTYTSIIATAQKYTDFIKSPALQKSVEKSDIDVNKLSDGNTVMYVIIPSDKLKSQSKWLRLVVTTTMRAVVRNPNKRVAFLLDEFAALGYMSEIETALSTYAGYGVTVWAIVQSLIQLQNEYGDNWETFLGNTNVQHFFSIGDNFTADYVSKLYGKTSYVTYERTGLFGIARPKSTSRELVTPDEVRRASLKEIFVILDKAYRTYKPKVPYFTMPWLEGLYDENPYMTDQEDKGGSTPPPPPPPAPPRQPVQPVQPTRPPVPPPSKPVEPTPPVQNPSQSDTPKLEYKYNYTPPQDKPSEPKPPAQPPTPTPQNPESGQQRIGRNDPCPCGSGLKYKQCHGRGIG